jgi:hypothetical protein
VTGNELNSTHHRGEHFYQLVQIVCRLHVVHIDTHRFQVRVDVTRLMQR